MMLRGKRAPPYERRVLLEVALGEAHGRDVDLEVPALAGRAEVVAVLDGVDVLAADVAAAGEAHRPASTICV